MPVFSGQGYSQVNIGRAAHFRAIVLVVPPHTHASGSSTRKWTRGEAAIDMV